MRIAVLQTRKSLQTISMMFLVISLVRALKEVEQQIRHLFEKEQFTVRRVKRLKTAKQLPLSLGIIIKKPTVCCCITTMGYSVGHIASYIIGAIVRYIGSLHLFMDKGALKMTNR